MGVVNLAGAFGLGLGIEPEQDFHRLLPSGAVGLGIEQAAIELHMGAVVVREKIGARRFVTIG
jgi:hypothetical protein